MNVNWSVCGNCILCLSRFLASMNYHFLQLCVFRFLFCFLSPLVWFFLWLPDEVLTLLFSSLLS
jgi:hypothetical protein